jgi:hypothetical protein
MGLLALLFAATLLLLLLLGLVQEFWVFFPFSGPPMPLRPSPPSCHQMYSGSWPEFRAYHKFYQT